MVRIAPRSQLLRFRERTVPVSCAALPLGEQQRGERMPNVPRRMVSFALQRAHRPCLMVISEEKEATPPGWTNGEPACRLERQAARVDMNPFAL